MNLIGLLGLRVVVQEGSLNRGAHDGQTLPCLQLIGQREQTRLLHVLLRVHAHQDQDLRPDGEKRKEAPSLISLR